MRDLIDGIIGAVLSNVFGTAAAERSLSHTVVHGFFFCVAGYFLFVRWQLNVMDRSDPKSSPPLAKFWLVYWGAAAFGIHYGFDPWPALILIAGVNILLRDSQSRYIGLVPGIGRIRRFTDLVKNVQIAYYNEFIVLRELSFWRQLFTKDARVYQNVVTAVSSNFAVTLVDPAFLIAAVGAFLVSPVGAILRGRNFAQTVLDVTSTLGTSLLVVLVIGRHSLAITTKVYCESRHEADPPSPSDIVRARTNVQTHLPGSLTSGCAGMMRLVLVLVVILAGMVAWTLDEKGWFPD